MARTPAAPTTPLRRSTRSSSRKREASPVSDVEEKAPVKPASRARSSSRSRKAATPTKSPTKRSNSKKRATAAQDSDDEVEAPKPKPKPHGKSKTPTKGGKKAVATAPASRRRSSSRSRVSAKDREDAEEDEDEEEEEDAKPVKKATPRSKSPAKPKPSASKKSPRSSSKSAAKAEDSHDDDDDDDDEEEAPAAKKTTAKKPVRTRSRSRGRADKSDSEDTVEAAELVKKAAPRSSRVTRTSQPIVEFPSDSEVDGEPHPIMHRQKTPVVFVKTTDIAYLAAVFIFPLTLALFNIWNVSPTIREVLITKFAVLAKLERFHLNTLYVLLVNTIMLFITSFLVAYKLRRSDTAPRVTSRITSMIFRGFISKSLLLTWIILRQYGTHPVSTLQALAFTLLPFVIVECFYMYEFQTFARWIEQFLLFVVSYHIVFKLPHGADLLASSLAPTIVVYLILNFVLSVGYVGILSTSNTTHTSMTVTSVSHAFIWLHLLLAVGGPVFVLYFEVFKDLTVLRDQTQVITKGVAVLISVLLSFTNYADSFSIEYLNA